MQGNAGRFRFAESVGFCGNKKKQEDVCKKRNMELNEGGNESMSFCKKCGSVLADDAAFCESCGTAVAPSGAPVSLSSDTEQGKTSDGLNNQEQANGPSQPAMPAKKSRIRIVAIVCAILVVVAAVAIAAAIILFSGRPAPEGESADSTVSSNLAAEESDQGRTKNASQIVGEWEIVAVLAAGADEFSPVGDDAGGAVFEESGKATLTLASDVFKGSWMEMSSLSDEGNPFIRLVLDNGLTCTMVCSDEASSTGEVLLIIRPDVEDTMGFVMRMKN